jgi:MFS family permease
MSEPPEGGRTPDAAPPAERHGPPRWREVFQGALGRLTLGLFLLEVVGAIEILVVTTVMPRVVQDLGGLRLYGLAFSVAGLGTVIAIPLTGRAVDRVGTIRPLAIMLCVFAGGTLIAGLAPTMPVFVLGRFLQGLGAGAQFAVSIGAVAKTYPDELRPRVLALLAAAWALPGLIGPSFGALMASTVGWRWAFIALLPLIGIAAALVFPGLAGVARTTEPSTPRATSIRWPIQTALGSAALLGGISDISVFSVALVAVGLLLVVPGIRHLVRDDAAGSKPGLAWALAAGFLLTFCFFATDGFVPLMLTRIRGLSVAEASIVITLATLGWSAGSWWQSRVAETIPAGRLVGGGAIAIMLGIAGVAAGAFDAPLVVPKVYWALAGLAMGVAYPTVYLVTMERAGVGVEGTTVALLLLIDSLGASAGTGLGGGAIALSQSLDASLISGLMGAFALALAAGAALLFVSPRLSGAVATPSAA